MFHSGPIPQSLIDNKDDGITGDIILYRRSTSHNRDVANSTEFFGIAVYISNASRIMEDNEVLTEYTGVRMCVKFNISGNSRIGRCIGVMNL